MRVSGDDIGEWRDGGALTGASALPWEDGVSRHAAGSRDGLEILPHGETVALAWFVGPDHEQTPVPAPRRTSRHEDGTCPASNPTTVLADTLTSSPCTSTSGDGVRDNLTFERPPKPVLPSSILFPQADPARRTAAWKYRQVVAHLLPPPRSM